MVYDSHLTIVPGDRNRIPSYFRDMPAISGITSPINAIALPKAFRLVTVIVAALISLLHWRNSDAALATRDVSLDVNLISKDAPSLRLSVSNLCSRQQVA